MHYLIQTTLEDLKAVAVEVSYYDYEAFEWKTAKQWNQSGNIITARFPSGQAVIHGPISVGNPNKPWFEIQCEIDEVLADIGANVTASMRSRMRTDALMRAAYRASGCGLIRNSTGKPVGPMPAHVICGTHPAASFLGDLDVDDADELLDMEP